DLREARGLLERARAAAREERKHAALVLPAARLDLLLGQTHPGDLRRHVDDRRDHFEVHLYEAPGDEVGDHHALLLALVGQHRAAHAVPDRPHTLDTGAAGLIDRDEAALIELHTGLRAQEVLGVGTAADCHHQSIDGEALSALAVLVGDLDRTPRDRSARDLGAEADIEAELLEVPQRLAGELLVGERQEVRQRFQHHDLRSEPAPHAPELESDYARADDAEPLRYRLEFERTPGVDDVRRPEGSRAQLDRSGAGGEHHVAGGEPAALALVGGEFDPAARQQLP